MKIENKTYSSCFPCSSYFENIKHFSKIEIKGLFSSCFLNLFSILKKQGEGKKHGETCLVPSFSLSHPEFHRCDLCYYFTT